MAKRVRINGAEYMEVLLQVRSRDVFSRPRGCEMLYDDSAVNINGGEEFLTVFIRADMVKPVGKETV